MFTGNSHMPTPTKTMHFANSTHRRQREGRRRRVRQHAAEDRDDRPSRAGTGPCARTRRRRVRCRLVAGTATARRLRLDEYPFLQRGARRRWNVLRHGRRHGGHAPVAAARESSAIVGSSTTGFRHRTVSRRRHPAAFNGGNATRRRPVRRSPRVVQAGHALQHDVPHVAEDRRLGADQRERAVVHEVRRAQSRPRNEDEFIEYGENMPLHREPVDGTKYERVS